MHLHRRARSFAPLGLSLSLAACGPDHRQQLHTDLPSEGYALFRVEAGGALVDVQAASPGSEQLLLRHQLLAKGGYYAVMRVEKTGPTLPINVEVSSMDEAEPFDPPNVERVR
jgi:hypothetical protein